MLLIDIVIMIRFIVQQYQVSYSKDTCKSEKISYWLADVHDSSWRAKYPLCVCVCVYMLN